MIYWKSYCGVDKLAKSLGFDPRVSVNYIVGSTPTPVAIKNDILVELSLIEPLFICKTYVMITSKIDGTECKNNLGLSIHLKKYGIKLVEYYLKYENFVIPNCVICGENCKLRGGLEFMSTCGSKSCINDLNKQIINENPNSSKNSEVVKEKIRKARVKHLKKTRGKGSAWERRSQGKMSKGEEKLHDIFVENGIYEKYDVVNEYCEFPYFIDFAFVNEKVAVEYDGKCHFTYGKERVEHDHKKDKTLNELGWRVFRLPYFMLDDFKVGELIDFIGEPNKVNNFNTLVKYCDYIQPKKLLNSCECGKTIDKKSKQCTVCCGKKRRTVQRPPYEQLLSEINEMGYKGTGKKYGVSDNAIRKWLKGYS